MQKLCTVKNLVLLVVVVDVGQRDQTTLNFVHFLLFYSLSLQLPIRSMGNCTMVGCGCPGREGVLKFGKGVHGEDGMLLFK